jgi:uncharacterized membrane protein
MMSGSGWPFWEVALMWAGAAVVVCALIWVAYALTAGDQRRPARERRWHAPREILDERLASGDIDGAEYKRLRAVTRHRQD